MSIKIDFSGKLALVVGSSKGIGKGVVEAFKNAGASVLEVSKSQGTDISNKDSVDKFFTKIDQLDFVINVAGINYCKPVEDISFEEWNEVLNTNLRSFYYVIKKSIPLLKTGGRIVNVSSIAGRNKSLVSGVHYTSSKAGIIGLTRQLAQELGPRGINVNCLCPSQTLTPMLEQSMTSKQIEELSKKIPLRRIATVQDQVGPILFLCSELASYLNGAIIDVNGGQL